MKTLTPRQKRIRRLDKLAREVMERDVKIRCISKPFDQWHVYVGGYQITPYVLEEDEARIMRERLIKAGTAALRKTLMYV